jgi:hypothetical protein
VADPDFKVVFNGALVEGADPQQVRANLAKMFKTNLERIEQLFSHTPSVIKKGLDEAAAQLRVGACESRGDCCDQSHGRSLGSAGD